MPKMQFVSFIQRRIYVIGKARSLAPTFLGLKLKWTIACAATHYYTQARLGQPSSLRWAATQDAIPSFPGGITNHACDDLKLGS